MKRIPFAGLAMALLLAACAKQPAPAEPAAPASPTTPAATAAVPASWPGKWTGVEGTWLEIASTGGAWTVTVSNLDGPRSFPATAADGTLAFERDGVRETLHATDGAGTGMKWLADKRNCIAIKSGEGFCRD